MHHSPLDAARAREAELRRVSNRPEARYAEELGRSRRDRSRRARR